MKSIWKTLAVMLLGGLGFADSANAVGACGRWGCGTNSPAIAGAHAGPSSARVIAGCNRWGCGTNSPAIDSAQSPFEGWGQNLNSPLVASGVSAGAPFHELAIADAAMTLPLPVGTTIDVRDDRGAHHAMRVAAHGSTRFWAGSDRPIVTHVLVWSDGGAARPVCTAGANEAILYAGDRYDARLLAVTATGAAAAGWVNVACAGTAIAKLYLLRHTEASQEVATTRAERQAMLKMLAADAHGDGRAFTVAGQPLTWADAKQITRFAASAGAIEAVWTEHGAACLNVPRIAALEDTIVANGRRPPRCDELDALPPGHVVSAHRR